MACRGDGVKPQKVATKSRTVGRKTRRTQTLRLRSHHRAGFEPRPGGEPAAEMLEFLNRAYRS
jgi:hypothetical protein